MLRSALVVVFVLSLPLRSVFAEGRELAPRGGGPTSNIVYSPRTGYAADRFLTVWRESMGEIGTPLMCALSDVNGQRISPLAFPIDGVKGDPLQVVGTGDAFALITASGPERYLTDLDLEGRVLRTRPIALPSFVSARFAWNGSRLVAALRMQTGTMYSAEAILLDRDGETVRAAVPLRASYASAIVPWADGFTIVTAESTGIFITELTNDGGATEHPVTATALSPTSVVAVATPAGGVLIAWAQVESEHAQLRSIEVSRAGDVRDTDLLLDVNRHEPLALLHLLRDGDEYVLVYSSAAGISLVPVGEQPETQALDVTATDWSAVSNGAVIFVAYRPPSITPIRSIAVNAAGVRTRDVVSYSRTRQTQPALAAAGGRYLAVWTEIAGEAAYVRAASTAPDAEPLTDRLAGPAFFAAQELAWNGVDYLTVQARDPHTLVATRLAYDGTVLSEALLPLESSRDPWWDFVATPVWAGDRWLVLWPESITLRAAEISSSGVAAARTNVTVTSPLDAGMYRVIRAMTLVANGGTLLMAWAEQQREACSFPPCRGGHDRTFVARVSADGRILDAHPLEVASASTLSLASNGREFLLIADGTAYAIDASAAPRITNSRQLIDARAYGDVTWDGTSYAVALRYSGLRWYTSVTHLDGNAAPIGTPVFTETLPPDRVEAPSIAALFPGAAMVALQEGDSRNGARAVVYAERSMIPLPQPPPAPRNVRVAALPDGRFEATWDAADGTVDHYLIEGLTRGGAWTWAGVVGGTAPLRIVTPFATVRVRAFNAGGTSPFATLPSRRRASRP